VVCDDEYPRSAVLTAVFSSRLPPILATNAFSAAIADLRARGVSLTDLTVTNPTVVGLSYPPDLLATLADPAGLTYAPTPFGLWSAREAVAREVSTAAAPIDPRQVILTASTSEAYSLLFKLLCDPGDIVLTPAPSYPLFDLLTQLDGVVAAPYRLEHHGLWSIDRESMARAWSPRAKAILVVSPNNPTGSMVRRHDRAWLVAFAQERSLAIISDEVFSGYPVDPGPDVVSLQNEERVLTFTLGGLSKSAGLPQVKLGWIVVSGPEDVVADAQRRLELICDAYLSVSTPVQVAAPTLIAEGAAMRVAIRARVMENHRALQRIVVGHPSVRVLPLEGGWSAMVRVPTTGDEEALVLRILDEAHVVVHPGYFFDVDHGSHLVVSLLPEPTVFAAAVRQALDIAS